MDTLPRHALIAPTSSTPAIRVPPAACDLSVGPWRMNRIEPSPHGGAGCPEGIAGYLVIYRTGDVYEVETVMDACTFTEAHYFATLLDLADRVARPRHAWPERLIVPVLECGHIREARPLTWTGEQ